jgi:hypothetical protein
MWSLLAIGHLTLILALGAGPDSSFGCPVLIKSAEDSISRAGAMTLGPEARELLEQAKTTLAEAKKNQASARAKIDYANCMWKARTAQAQAEAAAAISSP